MPKITQKEQPSFGGKTDEELCRLAESDAEALECLLERYKNLVRAKARSYFLIGADAEDIMQEGMIGLYKAIRDFKEDMSNFHAFADLCITRQIISAVKAATRQKHMPLNSYVSLNRPAFGEESERTLLDLVAVGRAADPEQIIISREDLQQIRGEIREHLSDLEYKVWSMYLDGRSYQSIAARLGRPEKSVDNALQRIKTKLAALIGRH